MSHPVITRIININLSISMTTHGQPSQLPPQNNKALLYILCTLGFSFFLQVANVLQAVAFTNRDAACLTAFFFFTSDKIQQHNEDRHKGHFITATFRNSFHPLFCQQKQRANSANNEQIGRIMSGPGQSE